jgi:hypothetical protein
MSLPGKFAVDPSGASTYTIPIVVPPGTAGVTPSLSLEYSSRGDNGVMGVGWSFGGLPSVGRCRRTPAQDGVNGSINYDSNDRFCLEGQRLIAVSGVYGSDGTEYRTEIESYSRITSHGTAGAGPAWFEVRTKTGQIMEFGHTSDSQILTYNNATARAWALNKISDTKGNYYTVTYVSDAGRGQVYPSEINYTGNAAAGLAPYNKVTLSYAPRTDTFPHFEAGYSNQLTGLLTNISTFANGTLVGQYVIQYQQGATTGRNRITSVQLCAGGNCLPMTSFTWTDAISGLNEPEQWGPSGSFAPSTGWSDTATPRYFADVNKDGLPDVVGIASNCVWVSLNTGTAFSTAGCWLGGGAFSPSTGDWADNNTRPRELVDVNGDGLPDIVGITTNCTFVSLNTGTSFGQPACWLGGGAFSPATGYWPDNNITPRFFTDANGDGRPDIVGITDNCVFVSLNTGTSFGAPQCWLGGGAFAPATGWTDMNTMPRYFIDANGDGLPDIVGLASNCVFVSLNTGTSFQQAQCWLGGGAFAPATGWTDMNMMPRYFADVNGDGLPDIMGIASNCVFVSLNTGTSFQQAQCWLGGGAFAPPTGWPDTATAPRYLVDVTGDGLPDIVGIAPNCIWVSVNIGAAFRQADCWLGGGAFSTATGWPVASSSGAELGTGGAQQAPINDNSFSRVFIDLKGTGFLGIAGFAAQGVVVATSKSTGPSPDLISSISSGIGAALSIEYVPATNATVVTNGSGAAFPTFDLVGPLYVVAKVGTSNGIGGTNYMSYAYNGGRIDIRGRGFLGFGVTVARDMQTSIAVGSYYYQNFPYIGLLAAKETSLGSQILNLTLPTYQFSNTSGAANVSTPSSSSAPYRVSVAQSVTSGSDLDGTVLPSTTSAFQYDAYGNATQVAVVNSDGHSKTTTNTYTNNATNWLLGRLTASTVTGQAP